MNINEKNESKETHFKIEFKTNILLNKNIKVQVKLSIMA